MRRFFNNNSVRISCNLINTAFFHSIKHSSVFFKNKKKLSPHKKTLNSRLNLNISYTNWYDGNCVNYCIVDFFQSLYTDKFYVFIFSGLGHVFCTPYTLSSSFFTIFPRYSKFSTLFWDYYSTQIGVKISNISTRKLYYSISPGTFTVVLGSSSVLHVKLPSFKPILISQCFYITGQNMFAKHLRFPANSSRLKTTTLSVRGIAKNPVDHPNGGNSNTKGSFKTPWGFYAKKNK